MDSISFDDVNQSKLVEYTLTPEGSVSTDLVFVSENPDVASFEDNKLVSVSEGETSIYAMINNTKIKSKIIKVTVIDAEKAEERQAQEVIDKIDSLGEITLDKKSAIKEAESLYNSLEPDVKAKISNYGVLEEAKTAYNDLAEAEKQRIEQEKAEQEAIQKSAQQAINTSPAVVNSTMVYIGATGTKYHKQSCSTLKGKGTAITLDQAISQGRDACKRCGG